MHWSVHWSLHAPNWQRQKYTFLFRINPVILINLHWQAIQHKVLKADCVIRQFSCRSKFLRILLRLFVRGCVWRLRVGLPTKKFPVPTRSFIFFCTNFLLCIKFVILNSQSFTQCNSRRFTSCFADNATAGAEIRSRDVSVSGLSQISRLKPYAEFPCRGSEPQSCWRVRG